MAYVTWWVYEKIGGAYVGRLSVEEGVQPSVGPQNRATLILPPGASKRLKFDEPTDSWIE